MASDLLLEEDFKDPESGLNAFLSKNRNLVGLGLLGLILTGVGVFLIKDGYFTDSTKIEVLDNVKESQGTEMKLVVEIAGAVEEPGVYKLENGARIEDMLIAAGGVSVDADREWMQKMMNRAAKLTDGQKIYIPSTNEQTAVLTANNSGLYQNITPSLSSGIQKTVNINTASASELESLWGIGRITAQNIIEQRPYSSAEELLTRKILKSNVYEWNKDLLTVY